MDTPGNNGSGVNKVSKTLGGSPRAVQPLAARWVVRFTGSRVNCAPPLGIHHIAPHYDLPDGDSSRRATAERIMKK